jgi:protein-disulfide isomerase/cellobiose-specific phosphotransferase system component IIB
MRLIRTAGSLLAILSLSALAMAAETKAKPEPKAKADAAAKATAPKPLASVGDKTITDADVQALVGPQIQMMWNQFEDQVKQRRVELASREDEVRRAAVEELIARDLVEREAKARGVSVEELTKVEVEGKIAPVTADERKLTYESQKQKYGQKSEEEGLKLAEDEIRQRRMAERRKAFATELRAKGGVKILIEPKRVAVSLDDDPVRGPKTAPVTILEFSDFQCPYCAKVTPMLKQLEDRYGDKLKVVYRDYPLSFHPFAAKAAEAASCANDQGKFWEMHDKIFANQQKLAVEDLKANAASLGMDAEAFDKCLDSGKYTEEWKKDLAEGTTYGVTGTPAFFINGRYLNGAVPLDKFTAIIDEELERAGIPPPAPPAKAASADR